MQYSKYLLLLLAITATAQPVIRPGGSGSGSITLNTNQFTGNTTLKSGALTTNLDLIGAHPSLLQITGTANTPTTGSGLEMLLSGGIGVIESYNRDGTVYLPLYMDGLTLSLRVSGATKGYFDSTRFTLGVNQQFGWAASADASGAITNQASIVNGAVAENFTLTPLTNNFVLATRYTNTTAGGFGTQRAIVAASVTLNGAAAGTAKATLYVEHPYGSLTNKLSISAGPLASLTVIDTLELPVSPGAIFRFVDESSGSGASISIVAGTCSWFGF